MCWMSFTVQDYYDMKNIFRLTMTWFFMKSEKNHVMNVIQSWRPVRLEKKHLHCEHNMIFYEERKSSCDECHSKLKTTTTWENTCTLTITWFFMKSEKNHVMNVIQSWRPIRLEKTLARWPLHDFIWGAKKLMCWVSFRVEDLDDLRKHLHIDPNMIFYEER